jgi:hypothetical protein
MEVTFNMGATFLWLAIFFRQRYRPIFEKRCRVRVDAIPSEDSLIIRLWDRQKSISYSLKEFGGELFLFRNDALLAPRGKDAEGNPFPYAEGEVMYAFRALASVALDEAICVSIRRAFARQKISAVIYTLDIPPTVEVRPKGEEQRYLIVPRVRDDKLRCRVLQRDPQRYIFGDPVVLARFEIPLRDFRPDTIVKIFSLLRI